MNISSSPYLTADLPGTGGRIKGEPEDFLVEEIPAYLPSGEGTHIYLWIEKRDVSAKRLLSRLAQHFGVSKGDIGVAGNKDRQAVTRQWVSIPEAAVGEREVEELVGPIEEGITVLEARRHQNKLRTGHLKGNRFRLTLRELEVEVDEGLARAEGIMERMSALGMPNYYGTQRFGREGETLRIGLGLLSRDAQITRKVGRDRFMKRLALSAVQSEVFNRVLGRRIEEGLFRSVLEGDVMQKVETGGIFVVEGHEREEAQGRLEEGEIVVTGPMPGPKMRQPEGVPLGFEAAALEEQGLRMESFSGWGKLMMGTRRPLAVYPEFHGIEAREGEDCLVLDFSLPSGSYATVLVGEVTKKTCPDE